MQRCANAWLRACADGPTPDTGSVRRVPGAGQRQGYGIVLHCNADAASLSTGSGKRLRFAAASAEFSSREAGILT